MARNKSATRKPQFEPALIAEAGLDTINQATSMLEHLTDQMGERKTDASFGQWLLYRTVVGALRHGVEQVLAEQDELREVPS